MTEEEYDLEQKRLKSLIAKNQRLAREYNQNIRLGKRQLKELERTFKKELREKAKAEKPPKYTPSYLECSVDYCNKYGDESGFCWAHNPNKAKCVKEGCSASALKGENHCGKHNPDPLYQEYLNYRKVTSYYKTYADWKADKDKPLRSASYYF